MGTGGAGVDGCRRESWYAVEKMFFGVVGKVMGLGKADVGGDGDVGLGAQGVSDPADTQFSDAVDAVDAGDRICCLVDQARVHRVQQSGADLANRRAEHAKDPTSDNLVCSAGSGDQREGVA